MAKGLFRLVQIDQGGVRESQGGKRLVCLIESGGKLAIWGEESPTRNMRNIESVLEAGMPCTVECEDREPSDWAAQQFGHTHWVPQDYPLMVTGRGTTL